MTDLLRGVIERGTGRNANIGRPAAGKTGTHSDYQDAWFVGYTPIWWLECGLAKMRPSAWSTKGDLRLLECGHHLGQLHEGSPENTPVRDFPNRAVWWKVSSSTPRPGCWSGTTAICPRGDQAGDLHCRNRTHRVFTPLFGALVAQHTVSQPITPENRVGSR